ncbi:MAG: stretch-activated Ca2+-permeable channel component-domain-containing protein [Linnemannia gamsii]|nr:MAG: stretch-activated Ca2+-permeable channel component-domain-containing protein [Linnemannia gamsii]
MLHNTKVRLRPCWRLLSLALCLVAAIPIALAQTTPVQPGTSLSVTPPSTPVAPPPTAPTTPPTPPAPVTLPPGTRELRDGQVVADKVTQGQLQTYHFSIVQGQSLPVKRQLERIIFHPGNNQLEKRQAPPVAPTSTTGTPAPTRVITPTIPSPGPDGEYVVFISVSTCSTPKSGGALCPPLEFYVSTSASQPLPGPGQSILPEYSEDGLMRFTVRTKKDVFFSLHSPSLTGTWTGDWAVEVGASTQDFVQDYRIAQGLVLDDTDGVSASFLTHNFTAVPTFKVFVLNSDTLPVGLTRSICAIEVIQPVPLTKTNMIVTQTNRTSNLDGSMGTEILPAEPSFEMFGQRRQVIVQSLTPGTNYTAFFITDVLNHAGAEVMFAMTTFTTKKQDNCVLITDLKFCQEVAYAVPITPQSTLPGGTNSTTRLDIKNFYDNFTSNLMDNFNRVLEQYDCSRSQYSLIRNCTDCSRAYRRWLCSISIPRCTDVGDILDGRNVGYAPAPEPNPDTVENPYLIDRTSGAVVVARSTNTSRGAIAQLSQNPLMDPGPYGEVLPCIDLCFDVVQSCPNFLGFDCPVKNMGGNYAKMNDHGFRCNGLGVVPVPSAASRLQQLLIESRVLCVLFVVVGTIGALVL